MPVANLQLPGVYFLPSPPAAAPALPPLDVAGFVGFAERGPCDLPVPVEDGQIYRAVFGGDLPLAQEPVIGGRTIYAHLPSAVAGFFANGGRRCYVVRVTGVNAVTARFRVPGLIAIGDQGIALPTIAAASPGAWANRLRLATRLDATALPPNVFTVVDARAITWQTGSAPDALQPGDVLRLSLADGSTWLFPIAAAERTALTGAAVTLRATNVWRFRPDVAASPPLLVEEAYRVTTNDLAELAIAASPVVPGSGVTLQLLPGAPSVDVGEVLWLRLSDGETYLFAVAEARRVAGFASPPVPTVELSATGLLHLAPPAGPTALPREVPLHRVERLRFALLLRFGDAGGPTLSDLAFNAGHPRFWGEVALLESTMMPRQPSADGVFQSAQLAGPLPRSGPAGQPETAATRAARIYRVLQTGARPEPALDGGLDPTALAGLLAPLEADSGQTYLPLSMGSIVDEAGFIGQGPVVTGEDDLGTFGLESAALFLDPYLVENPRNPLISANALMAAAFDRYYVQNQRLLGLHGLTFVDEVALVAVPDAGHRSWAPGAPQPEPILSPLATPTGPAAAPCPPSGPFAACEQPPAITGILPAVGRLRGGELVSIVGTGFAAGQTTVTFGGNSADDVQVLDDTTLAAQTPPGASTGPVAVTVTTPLGTGSLADAFTYQAEPTSPPLPVSQSAEDFDLATSPLLPIQRALIAFCEARSDVVGILTLPRHFEKRHCIDWQQTLRQQLGLPRRGSAFADVAEIADLSYAAVYHPWLLLRDPTSLDGLRAVPSDGAVCGAIAGRERDRGVWIAPANVPFQGVLGLVPTIDRADWADLFDQQFNLIREEPRDFRAMSAHTLSDERTLLQLSVRRLLILLRKACKERGMDFVFEPNHERFREGVQIALEGLLRFMFDRGAFAGATPGDSFRVDTGVSVNPPQSVDRGRFVAQIQVAPSQPTEFITVLLTRTDTGLLQSTEA